MSFKTYAQEAILEASRLIDEAGDGLKNGKRDVSEQLFRKSLTKLREAYLCDRTEENMIRLHNVGRRVHSEFLCPMRFESGNYWRDCPVTLAHGKMGVSVGGSAKAICSICGEDALSCIHHNGRLYNGVVARRLHSTCNICHKEGECSHTEGQVYDGVEAISIMVDLKFDHLTLTENPADPRCAIMELSFPLSDILKSLPEDEKRKFVYGKTTLYCHHCSFCSGVLFQREIRTGDSDLYSMLGVRGAMSDAIRPNVLVLVLDAQQSNNLRPHTHVSDPGFAEEPRKGALPAG